MLPRRLAAAAALLAALTACNTDNGATADDKPKPTASEPAADSPTPTPESAEPMTLGDAWEWESLDDAGDVAGSGSAAAVAYTQPITGLDPPDDSLGMEAGAVWGQLEAKVCNDVGGSITVDQFPWQLAFDDGTRAEITGLNGGDFPKPEFPMDATVRAGDCARGTIMFPVPPDTRPERIVYAPEGLDEPVEWTVPAK